MFAPIIALEEDPNVSVKMPLGCALTVPFLIGAIRASAACRISITETHENAKRHVLEKKKKSNSLIGMLVRFVVFTHLRPSVISLCYQLHFSCSQAYYSILCSAYFKIHIDLMFHEFIQLAPYLQKLGNAIVYASSSDNKVGDV